MVVFIEEHRTKGKIMEFIIRNIETSRIEFIGGHDECKLLIRSLNAQAQARVYAIEEAI